MPVFEIQAPDGRTFEIDAPDQGAALQALGSIARPRAETPGPGLIDTGIDIAKSFGSGVVRGAAQLAGMGGDIAQAGESGLQAMAKAGLSGRREAVAAMPAWMRGIHEKPAPDVSSAAIMRGIDNATGLPVTSREPETMPGHFARTIGEFAPNAIGGGGSIPFRVGVGVVAPAVASEAAGQLTKGKPSEGLARIAGALAGGVGGGMAAAAVNNRRSMIPGMSGPSSRIMEKAVTPDAERRLAELGPDAMLLDASPDTLRWAQAVATRPGEGMAPVIDAVTRRNQGTNARLGLEMDQTLGRPQSPEAFIRSNDEQLAQFQPLYEQVTQLNEPVHLQHVWDQLRVAVLQQSGETQRVLRQIEDMIAPVFREEGSRGVPGQRMLRTNPREVLHVRQELDQLHGRLGDSPKAQREVSEYRRLVDEALGEAVPDLKIIDQSYANLMREREALQRGSQIFDTGKEAIRPEDLIRERQGMTLPQREAMRYGAVAEFDRRVGTSMNDLQALRSSVMSAGDWNPAKMAEVFGGRETQRIMNAIDREAAFREAYNKIAQNSQTAQRLESLRTLDREAPDPRDLRGATLTGLALSGGKKVVDAVRNRIDDARVGRVSADLGRALTTTGNDRDALVRAIREAQRRRKNGSNATRDMLVRALMNAQAAR